MRNLSRIATAIVPAAGLSSRFGGANKLLQPWAGSTLVGSVVGVLIQAGLPPLVVTGRDSEQVARAVAPATTVFNDRYEEGLGTSIAAGIKASGLSDGFLIALGDMPGLRADVIERLLKEFEEADDTAILAPVYASEPDRPGHPVLFGAAYRGQLEALTGDEGARSIVQANRSQLRLVEVQGGLDDFDTPAALSAADEIPTKSDEENGP